MWFYINAIHCCIKQSLRENYLLLKGEFNVAYYKKIKKFGLQAPAGYVLEQYIKQNNIAANTDYDLNLGIHQVAIARLDGYLVEKRIGLA